MDEVTASSEMKSFLQALKIPISKKTGDAIPLINSDISPDNYTAIYDKIG
mgnify:CR=1 FL=1